MKKCPQCATENTELAKFCKECGYPIGVNDGFEDEDTTPDLSLKGSGRRNLTRFFSRSERSGIPNHDG